MGMDLSIPMLERSPIFQYVLDSRQPYQPDLKLLTLPPNHMKLTSALLVPIVVDGKALGLAGFGGGIYSPGDANVLFESLPSAWMTVIAETVKETSSHFTLISNTLPAYVIEKLMNGDPNSKGTSSSILSENRANNVSQLFIGISVNSLYAANDYC